MGGSPIRGVFPREYARSGHSGVFYLRNLKVSTLRFLKNSVGKVVHFESGQQSTLGKVAHFEIRGKKTLFCVGNMRGCAIMGCFT